MTPRGHLPPLADHTQLRNLKNLGIGICDFFCYTVVALFPDGKAKKQKFIGYTARGWNLLISIGKYRE
jgi:hypothetical protein